MKLIGRFCKIIIILILLIILAGVFLSRVVTEDEYAVTEGYDKQLIINEEKEYEEIEYTAQNKDEGNKDIYLGLLEDSSRSDFIPIFTSQQLPDEIIHKIKDVSWKTEAAVALEDLSYITVTYWGFDEQEHIGELILHRKVAEEIVDIFKELYEAKFPIEKIKLIDEYNADDNLSMQDNNTSAFCFRNIEGSNTISLHGYGVAIDINPVQNPYVRGEKVVPLEGKNYLNRSDIRKGMILKGDSCYNAFINRGWTWGGDWKGLCDYQHFEKDIN